MHSVGDKQVEIVGPEDKRQITALLTCSMSGKILPPQLLYQGKTLQCTPTSVRFPQGWDIHFSENHWSNEETMCRFVDTILLPYINKMRDSLDLPLKQPALCIFDVFAAHRTESFLKKLKKNGIIVKFIPGGCTGELQPLDLSGNAQFKDLVKKRFVSWYATEIKKELKAGKKIDDIKVDLKLSSVKVPHANWVIDALKGLESQRDVIRNGWYRSGMLSD
ncbi:uncharacterized protein LOC134266007 [Saccostrea cucullata]|uniref:uncharacterized protein LOC134266007 n=1 Tax=Saccostrea cuccullata TaxID=36930 RepID=UPI002ED00715